MGQIWEGEKVSFWQYYIKAHAADLLFSLVFTLAGVAIWAFVALRKRKNN